MYLLGQLSQNEPGNGLNTERSQSEMKIVSTSKNHFSDTGTDANKLGVENSIKQTVTDGVDLLLTKCI